jgi:hypothetical protein
VSATLDYRRTPFQFTLRSLFVVVTLGALLCALSNVRDETFGDGAFLFRDYAVLAVIYFGRFHIRRTSVSRTEAMSLFGLLVLSLLPFVYWYICTTPDDNVRTVGKWIGDPVGVFAVPCTSFLIFDMQRKREGWKSYVLRTIVELSIAFPVWNIAWVWAQVYLGWVKMPAL